MSVQRECWQIGMFEFCANVYGEGWNVYCMVNGALITDEEFIHGSLDDVKRTSAHWCKSYCRRNAEHAQDFLDEL